MSTISDKAVDSYKFHIERFDSAAEVVEKCRSRKMTSSRFDDVMNMSLGDWYGVDSYDQALEYMRTGYQPTVESMRGVFKANKMGEGTRFSFRNEIQGFAPVVPLALKNVPNCMVNMMMKPIKAKVIDIYYDSTVVCSISSEKIIEAGQKLLGTIIEMERQGYRFNLYAVQNYSDSNDSDMMIVRLKNASQPLDLKRVSFPLTHTAFFRVIGFDWYSKMPGGRYRSGYGQTLVRSAGGSEGVKKKFAEMFGKNALYFSCTEIIKKDKEYIKEAVKDGNSKIR